MRTLPYSFENDDVRVVHAAMLSAVPLAEQREEILCGSTSGERALAELFPGGHWHEHYTDSKPVVFGHHVTGREPMRRDGRIFGLDTGACHGWNLTALCVPGFTVHSVPAHADHWSVTRRVWQLPVLKSRAWRDWTWAEVAAAVARCAAVADAETRDWLDAVEAWAGDLRSALPTLAAVARDLAAGRTVEQLRTHPAGQVLFQARGGRLDETALARRCSTPRRTADLAAALGLALPDLPR